MIKHHAVAAITVIRTSLLGLALGAWGAHAAQTDISSTPITNSTAAQAKPNIMLLMDTSGSMGWGHMPDEVETVTGIGSIGYKSAQCNALYYNPNTVYGLPRQADGLFFPTPSFTAARYDAFNTASSTTVNLSTSFKAYDDYTLRTSGFNDTPQAAYYYVYSGPQTLNYASAPCTDVDVGSTVGASGGGTWTRVVVGAGEQQNFANWYAYYRTRMALTKSAVSLAFTPLTDSYRVGFITVFPKNSPSDTSINSSKYLPIADFNTTQRGLWFDKLFSQTPGGSSPAREGLARVGRHYAGQTDGINSGMTGDPVQYSCQQNFTIMTTDGYWNDQQETPGGGPVQIDGVTKVGQQDGTLTAASGNTPRPIWDGFSDTTQTAIDKTRLYAYASCVSTYFSVDTLQHLVSTARTTAATSQLQQSTVQNRQSTAQNLRSTTQNLQSTTQNRQSTTQNLVSTSQILRTQVQNLQTTAGVTQTTTQTTQTVDTPLRSTTQNLRSTTQNTQSTTQNLQRTVQNLQSTAQNLRSTTQNRQSTTQTRQNTAQNLQSTAQNLRSTTQNLQSTTQTRQNTAQNLQSTTQNLQSTTQNRQSTTQNLQSTTQNLQSTTQNLRSTTQNLQSTSQVRQSTLQIRSCNASTEVCTPVASCTPSGLITCESVTTGPTLVATCTAASPTSGNNYTATTCATTVLTSNVPVASCTPAAASSGNSYTTTSCATNNTSNVPVASCTPATASSGNSYTTTTCSTNNTTNVPVASCTPVSAGSGNSYTATTCSTNNTSNVPVSSCTGSSATSANNYTTTTCSTNNTTNVPVSSCTPATASSGNSWTTTSCSTNNTSNVPVASCTSASATSGNSWTTTSCSTNNTSNVPVATCTPSSAVSGNNYTTTTCSTNNSSPVGVASCTPVAASSANSYTATVCSTNNTTNVAVASCVASGPTSGNGYTTTSCSTNNTTNVPVSSCTASSPTSGNGYTTTSCSTNNTSNVPVATCTAATASSGNSWTTTTCSTNNSSPVGVASCTPVAASSANSYTATVCTANNTTNVPVSSCTASGPTSGNSWTTTTCSTNNTTNVPVSSCTASGPTSGNSWTTTTCSTNNTSNVPVATCTAATASSGNSWTTTTCASNTTAWVAVASCTPVAAAAGNSYTATQCSTNNTTNVAVATCTPSGPTAGNGYTTTTCSTNNTTNVPVASCTASGPTSGNSWTTTTCSTNNTTNVPVASCTASGPTSGNGWTTTTCPAPILVSGPTPVASCTPVAASAGNGYQRTTCSTTNPTVAVASCTPQTASAGNSWTAITCNAVGAANVPVATCTPSGPTAGNGYITTTCPAPNVSTNVPVASCTPSSATAGNGYVTTTCPAPITTGPTPVATCAASGATSGNSYTTTTCSTNNTTNVPVSSCTADTASAGNSWTTTTCSTNNTTDVAVSSCTVSGPSSGNNWTTTTCSTNNTSNVPVSSCTASGPTSGNSWTTTTCSTNNTSNVPVATCTASGPTAGNNWTTTSCPAAVTTGPTGVSSCTPEAASLANNWTTTSCNTATTPATGVASCTNEAASAANSWTSTTCATSTTGPTAAASCTPATASSANNWTATTCSVNANNVAVSASCTPASATAGNNWTTTTCTPVNGQKVQYTTTTTTTVTPYSGGLVSGTPAVTSVTSAPVDKDGVCYVSGAGPTLEALPSPNPQSAPGDASCASWPCTSNAANSGGSINTLADVAQYYYVTDLRPTMPNDVPTIGGGAEDDRLKTQHMTTFSIALGVSGTLNFRSDYRSDSALTGDFAGIRTGAKAWPLWPDPGVSSWDSVNLTYTNKTTWNNTRSIDDFWHAAVNGRGQFFSARNPDDVVNGIAGALAGIQARLGGAAAGTATLAPVTGNNMAFTANYTTSQWTGDVEARTIDLGTGVLSTAVTWSASALLDARVSAACDNRTIYLMRQGATNNLTPFTWNTQACDGAGLPTGTASTGLNASEQAYFDAGEVAQLSQYPSMTDGTSPTVNQRTPAAGANLVNFLRGQRGKEGFVTNDAGKLYRTRTHVLGDIVGGQPIYVKGPFARYQDSGYLTYKTNNANRTPMVYVPANDGMLHAFYAETSATDPTIVGGKEAWAVIPSSVLPNLYKLADNNYGNLHQYSVDGVPAIGDVFDPAGAGAWKTILVGGLNLGGRGYYAMDVTDPASPKALWEFNWSSTCYNNLVPATFGADCHLGYTFGKPIITKLANGTWVVLVSSGHNNINSPTQTGDGQGYLYVLNALTGQILHKISTGEGDATTPSGLVHLNNFVDNAAINNTTLRVYGGDLLGNIWRFDINDTIAPSGREATLLGVAKDSSGNRQPITTRPELAELEHSPMVFVATGKLLGATDLTDTHTQSIYGLVDPLTGTSPAYADLRAALKPRVLTQVGTVPNATRTVDCPKSATPTAAELAACAATSGWVLDLPDAGERVNVDIKLFQGTMVVGSNVPQSSACTSGGYSWLTYLNFSNGFAVVNTSTGAGGSGGAGSSSSGAGMTVSQYVSNSLIVGLNVIRLPSGSPKTVLSTSGGGAGTTVTTLTGGTGSGGGASTTPCVGGGGGTASCDQPPPASGSPGKRVSWREIAQ